MMNIDETTSIKKLKSIIHSRFGKGLEVSRLAVVNTAEPTTDFYIRNSNLVIPIYQGDLYLGTAKVNSVEDLSSEQLSTLSSLIKMTLVPTLYNKAQDVLEKNLLVEKDAPVKKHLKSAVLFQEQNNKSDLKIISHIIHINGLSNISLKVAHQIHDIQQSIAFVPFELIKSKISNLEDILSLGKLTIFIKDLETLDLELQKLLIEYSKIQRKSSAPLFIISSSEKLSDVVNNKSIMTEFLLLLDDSTFEVNKAPMEYKKLQETVELLFFSESLDFP